MIRHYYCDFMLLAINKILTIWFNSHDYAKNFLNVCDKKILVLQSP